MGVSSLGKDHTWEINLAARAAWMSYVGDMTQSEIAKRLGMSSARVHRLIQLARQHGIIRISIEGRPAECLHLEAEIAARFALKSCTISPYLSDHRDNTDLSALSVGRAAGQVIAQHLMLPKTKSVTIDPFGPILVETVRAMPQFSRSDLRVWASSGCLSSGFHGATSEVLTLLEWQSGARTGFIPAPFIANSAAEWNSLIRLPSISSALSSAGTSDLFLGQINPANVTDETTGPDQAAWISQSAAACRFLGLYLKSDGSALDDRETPPTISISIDALSRQITQGSSRIFGIAADERLVDASLAALNSGLMTDLVLDEALARAIADHAPG